MVSIHFPIGNDGYMSIEESDLPIDRPALSWLRDHMGFKGLTAKALRDAFKDAHELVAECGGKLDEDEIILADGDRRGGIFLTILNPNTGKGRF